MKIVLVVVLVLVLEEEPTTTTRTRTTSQGTQPPFSFALHTAHPSGVPTQRMTQEILPSTNLILIPEIWPLSCRKAY
jgi:hypothetical protein